jgi:hypothetical protein
MSIKEYEFLNLTKLQDLAKKLFMCETECDCKNIDIRISFEFTAFL